MMRIGRIGVLVALALVCGAPASWSQDRPDDDALRRDVERRFEVLPLHDGLALRPKTPIAGVRSIEITGGTIAIDGQPATGAELQSRVGPGADAILQLSYMSDAARRALFAASQPTTPPSPPPVPPTVAPVPQPTTPEPPQRPRRSRPERRSGDRVRIGGEVTVAEDEVIEGDVVGVGGPVRVNGEVHGEVVAVGGNLTLGPHAAVDGDVTVVGGRLSRDPGAEVGGKAQEVSLGPLDFGAWSWRGIPIRNWWRPIVGSAFAFVGTLARVAVLCLLTALVVLFGREYADRAGAVAAASSVKAGAVGFLAQILFLPLLIITCVVLVMTIVGIPLLLLLPFVFLAIAAVALVGFTGVASRVGAIATHRLGWSSENPYAVTIAGVLIIMLPIMLSRLIGLTGFVLFPLTVALGIGGLAVEWTIGFGAVALMRFRRS
jgi:hypothetical protein